MPESVHISSLVVYARPEATERVARQIVALGRAEIAARSPGRLVVVLEAEHEGVLGDRLTRINLMDDVYVAAMVYHQVDSGDEEEATPDGANAGGEPEETPG